MHYTDLGTQNPIFNGMSIMVPQSDIPGVSYSPVGDTYRGIGSDWFNAENIAAENWSREQQALDNAWARDVEQMRLANEFTAQQAQITRDFNKVEAQKQRDFEERLSNTAFQRMMKDLELSGLNPVMLYASGSQGASVPSGSFAQAQAQSSSSPSSRTGGYSGGSYSADTGQLVGRTLMLIGQLVTHFTAGYVAPKTSNIGFKYKK